MRVAIDATPLLGPRTGVGVVVEQLLRHVPDASPSVELTPYALTWRGRNRLATEVPDDLAPAIRPAPARPLRWCWARADHPRWEHWVGRVDLVHGTNFVLPPSRAPGLVTVHDLTCIRFPDLCTSDTLAYPGLLRRAVRRGATIHAVSRFVAEECIELLRVPAEQVVVVPNGVAPPREPSGPDPGSSARARALAGRERYLLGLGTVEPRKDFPALVAAFDLLAPERPDLGLVIAGPDGWGAAALTNAVRRSPYRDRIRRLGWIADAERDALLAGAAVFVYPSRYEGFGFPPLEAMRAGVPVVATAVGALPETCGDGARLVPLDDLAALASAIGELLDDDTLAADLTARGREHVRRFRWEQTAAGLSTLYQRLADTSAVAWPLRR